MLPPASADILAAWRTSPYQRQYLNYIWIKGHYLEGTFHLVAEVSCSIVDNQTQKWRYGWSNSSNINVFWFT